MTLDLESLLPVAFRAVDTARDLILSRPPASVTEKSDRDLVSDVDLAIEQTIRTYLQQATPDISFLGEEEGGTSSPDTGWVWTLDPIDGTSNYAHRIPLCAVSLALMRDGRPVLGVIDAPFLGERFHAIEGYGAWCGTRRLSVSTTNKLRDAVVAIGDYAVGTGASRKNETRLAATVQLTSRVHRIRMLGTAALDLAWLADGRLDASITIDNNPWDVAAGIIIAQESGALVVDTNGNRHGLASTATIAAPEALITKIIPLIQVAEVPEGGDHGAEDQRESPYAALDLILSSARYLIFEFDGPVCDFSAVMPRDIADQLRSVLRRDISMLPPEIATTTDPTEIIARAVTIDPELAKHVDARLSEIELAGTKIASPSPYIYEALAACRDSGRTATIVSNCSEAAVSSYLARYSLADQVQCISAVPSYPPGHLQTAPHLLHDAISRLKTKPFECALITTSVTSLKLAQETKLETIGYAITPDYGERLTNAGATCVIPSIADLVLRLRARPLPTKRSP